MAKQQMSSAKKASAKKRVKKNVERGQAHIQSSIYRAMRCPGQVPVALDSEVQRNLLRMQLPWLQRLPQKQLSSMV